jgi:hypothetical protein
MRAFVVGVALVASGCLPKSYHCTTSNDCGAAGVCETNGFCAYSDSDCTSGLRYGDLSGDVAHVCVGDEPPIDAPPGSDMGGGSGTDSGSGSGMADGDGDGVPDATDNCPTIPNAMQENEDGDRFGDACDPCPPVADDNPPDGDGDGVADACDPRPTMPGDVITLFEGFHHGIPAGWEVVGTWTNPTDDAATSAGSSSILSVPGPTSKKETISTEMVIDQTGNTSGAGAFDDHVVGGNAMACIEYIAAVSPSPGLGIDILGTNTGTAVGYEMTVGAAYTMKLRRDMQMFKCDGANVTSGVAATSSFNNSLDNPTPSVGLWVSGATVRFHWLMVVSNP